MTKRFATLLLFALALPAAAAPFTLRSEVPVSPPVYTTQDYAGDPHIATDGDGYLVVWTDLRTGGEPSVYAARMRADGTVIDRLGLRVAQGASAGPVVWTGSKYLLVYDVEPAYTTYARTLTVDGVFGEPVEIGKAGRYGAIATNGTNVLVVLAYELVLLDLEGHKIKTVSLATPQESFASSEVAAAGSNYLFARATRQITTQVISSAGVPGPVHVHASDAAFPRVGLATDGQKFLVVWAKNRVEGQLIANDGTPSGPMRTLTTKAGSNFPKVVWRGNEYFVVLNNENDISFYGLRVGANGMAIGDPKHIARLGMQPTFTMIVRGGEGVMLLEDISARFFDNASLAGEEPFRKVVEVPVIARPQSDVHLARLGNGGYAAAWEEQRGGIFLSTAAGTTPVRVPGSGPLIDVLVDENDTIHVLSGSGYIYLTRYTSSLQPIDAEPHTFFAPGRTYATAALGNGTIALAHEVHYEDQEGHPLGEDFRDVAAILLRPSGTGYEREDILLTTAEFADHTAAVAFDGTAFVYGWVHAKGVYPEWGSGTPMPEHDILAARVSPDGELLDALPSVVATSPIIVRHLEAARGANGVAFAWHQDWANTPQVALFPGGAVRDFGGAWDFGTFVPHDGGFLLLRGHPRRTPELTEVEYLVLGADLSLQSSGMLPPYEADAYWKTFDIDVIGGADPVFAYAKSANGGTFGHVSRIFVRKTGEITTRRRAVR